MSASRKTSRPKLMGNHQRSWIRGKHAVLEAIRSERWRPLEVLYSDDLDPEIKDEIVRTAGGWDIDCEAVTTRRLKDLCHADDHQGLIARMPEYPYLSFPELVENLSEDSLLLVLDRIQDSFNFGASLRCAEVLGVDGVLIGEQAQAGVDRQVVRSSAGAVHHIALARHPDLTEAMRELQREGCSIVGASEISATTLPDAKLVRPLVIVIGNEGEGIAEERLALCDSLIAIPQKGRIGSLNTAVATGILLYEAVRQTTSDGNQT